MFFRNFFRLAGFTACLILIALSLPAFSQTVLLNEGFEGSFPPTGWHIKNLGDETDGETWMQSTSNPHTGSNCAFSQDGAGGFAMEEWLVTGPLVIPANSNCVLDFYHRFQWASSNDGPEYVLVSKTDTSPASFTDTIYTYAGVGPTDWTAVNLSPLPDYSGYTIYLAFVHTSADGYADAWVLDDIVFSYTTAGTADVGVTEIIVPPETSWIDSTYLPEVAIYNFGTTAQSGFWVRCRVDDGEARTIVYSDCTYYAETIDPGQTDTVLFSAWIPGAIGAMTVEARTFLDGDVQPTNDQLDKPITVNRHYHTGGPDNFGYIWIDSDTTGGPVYNWIDISGTGTTTIYGDDVAERYPMGFDFPFYGINRDIFELGTNGQFLLNLDNTWYPQSNPFNSTYHIPGYSSMPALVAVYWDDIDAILGVGNIYYQTFGVTPDRYTVVQWYKCQFASGGGDASLEFEVIFHENGDMIFQYKDVSTGNAGHDAGLSATVGIQNDEYTVGLEYLWNGTPVGNLFHDGLAIKFYMGEDHQSPVFTHTPNVNTFEQAPVITSQIMDASGIASDSLYYNVGSGWVAVYHDSVIGDDYYYHVPSQPRGTLVEYYLAATDASANSNRGTEPADAPTSVHAFKILPSTGVDVLFAYSAGQDWQHKEYPVFTAALDAAGITYDVFDWYQCGGMFSLYDYVYFISNSANAGDLQDEASDSLVAFLNAGTPESKSKLVVASDDLADVAYGWPNDDPQVQLVEVYLRAMFVLGADGDGLCNDPITYCSGVVQGESIDYLTWGESVDVYANSPDVLRPYAATWAGIDPADTSHTFMRFGPGAYAEGWPCGVKLEEDNYNSIFFSFDLSQMDSLWRPGFLSRAKEWLDDPTVDGPWVPKAIDDMVIRLSGNDIVLNWSPIEEDTTGQSIEIDHYEVYRYDTPEFLPPGEGIWLGDTPQTSFTHYGAAADFEKHFYIVISVR